MSAAVRQYLRTGTRSTAEVRGYLARRGLGARAAQRVVAVCRARGLLDDGAGVRLWAEHWARRGYAWAVIRERLDAKGFDAHAIMQAAGTYGIASEDEARARRLVDQLSRRTGGTPPHHMDGQRRKKLFGVGARALAARGFDPDVIERVLSETLGPLPTD